MLKYDDFMKLALNEAKNVHEKKKFQLEQLSLTNLKILFQKDIIKLKKKIIHYSTLKK